MGHGALEIGAAALAGLVGTPPARHVVDVRRRQVFEAAETVIPGAVWRPHEQAASWGARLPDGPVVVYCAHGHQVGQAAAAVLRAGGRDARFLDGGIEGYLAAGGATLKRSAVPRGVLEGGARWLAAAPLGLDAVAGAWLIRRFIDRAAVFLSATPEWAAATAAEVEATFFAVPGEDQVDAREVRTFADLLQRFGLEHPALARLDAMLAAGSMRECLETVVDGLVRVHGPGAAVIEPCLPLFDGLFAHAGVGS